MGGAAKGLKYARLRDEAKRLFKGIRGLAKAIGVNHSSVSKLINGKYGSDEENLKGKIEKAVLKRDPDFCVERLWDITAHYFEFSTSGERPVISINDLDMEFDLIAIFKRRR